MSMTSESALAFLREGEQRGGPEGQLIGSRARASSQVMGREPDDALLRLVQLAELQQGILLVVHGVLVVGVWGSQGRQKVGSAPALSRDAWLGGEG